MKKKTKKQPPVRGSHVFSPKAHTEHRIIRGYDILKDFIAHAKGIGLKIVLTQGTWDMVHIGHARYLEEAKNHGDLLIVGVDSDKKVKARKGPERPVVPETERLEMLTHLRSVDIVFLKELDDPKWALIKAVEPDILIATKETYNPKQLKELKQFAGEIKVLDPRATTSTSAKIRLLQIGTAKKLGQSLTPKIIRTIEEALNEVRG